MTDSVTYGLHYTRNLGNFENVKVYFEVTRAVREGESIDQAKDKVVAKVDAWVEDKVTQIDADAAE